MGWHMVAPILGDVGLGCDPKCHAARPDSPSCWWAKWILNTGRKSKVNASRAGWCCWTTNVGLMWFSTSEGPQRQVSGLSSPKWCTLEPMKVNTTPTPLDREKKHGFESFHLFNLMRSIFSGGEFTVPPGIISGLICPSWSSPHALRWRNNSRLVEENKDDESNPKKDNSRILLYWKSEELLVYLFQRSSKLHHHLFHGLIT